MTSYRSTTAIWPALLLLTSAAPASASDLTVGGAGSPTVLAAEGDEWESGEPTEVDAGPPQAPPPATAIPPPPSPSQVQPQPSAPSGQWVDTQQYGRIWIPYSDDYTYTPPSGYGEPYEYVYYPSYGWTWVVAPWIWGWGPWPVFGVYGAWNFGWYGHGWWRTPSRWHYASSYRSGGYYRGGQPGPYRAGFGGRGVRPPAFRGSGIAPRGFAVPGRGAPATGGWGHGASGGHRSGGRGR
jgi:hypothetical protein